MQAFFEKNLYYKGQNNKKNPAQYIYINGYILFVIMFDTNNKLIYTYHINNRRRGINTMILDAVQSKLATLRDMNNSGDINDYFKTDKILNELDLLSKIIAYPTNYKVEIVSSRKINVKLSFDKITDGIDIEF